ncbi:MAG TPA: AraC family transcriptional regulator ligand-binding domain-containing protein, partial [Polyangiales bacterium]
MQDASSMGTLSALHLKGTLVTLEHLGLSQDRVLAACGLTRAAFDNPFARFRVELEHRLWAAIEQDARDPAIGLRLGAEFVQRGRYELDIYLALNSRTPRLAFQNVQTVVRLADDRGYVDVSESAEGARVGVRRDGGYPRAAGALDTMFACAACFLHQRLPGFRLLRVHLSRPRPLDVAPYRHVFGVEPRFGALDNAIYFDAAWLDTPLMGA